MPQALVESHKYHAAESIDDVIVGKGKGLVGTWTCFPTRLSVFPVSVCMTDKLGPF